jgi:hypothetical protein
MFRFSDDLNAERAHAGSDPKARLFSRGATTVSASGYGFPPLDPALGSGAWRGHRRCHWLLLAALGSVVSAAPLANTPRGANSGRGASSGSESRAMPLRLASSAIPTLTARPLVTYLIVNICLDLGTPAVIDQQSVYVRTRCSFLGV